MPPASEPQFDSVAPVIPEPTFEEALHDLQQIVSELEGGTVTLDASLKRFEQGIGLLRRCYQFLDRADQRVEQLVSLDANGNCTLVPFDAAPTADKPGKPATSKSASKKTTRAKEGLDATAAAPNSPAEDADVQAKLLF